MSMGPQVPDDREMCEAADPRERSAHQQRVDRMMRLAGQKVPPTPELLSDEDRILRARLIFEEAVCELIGEGLGIDIVPSGAKGAFPPLAELEVEFVIAQPMNMDKTVDGCLDGRVVITGTLSACGVADVSPQRAVDENNLNKFGPGGHRRADGKWIKPPDHKPPDIAGELRKQGWDRA